MQLTQAFTRERRLAGVILAACFALLTVLPWRLVPATDKPIAEALIGTWKVTSQAVNGRESKDGQLTDAKLTFSGSELLIEPGDGSKKEKFTIKFEPKADVAAFLATRTEPKDRPQEGWFIYEFKGQRLRMAFFDALKERPKSFDARPKLIVTELEKVK